MHDQRESQITWDSHWTLSYYIGIAEHCYRSYKCYIPETKVIQISDTVEFFPKLVHMPKTSSNDRLAAALEDLNEVLKHPHPNTPFLDKGTTTNDAISKLKQIFGPPKKDNNLPRVQEDVPTPRVIRNNQHPRVAQTRQRLEIIAEEPIIYPIGIVMQKRI